MLARGLDSMQVEPMWCRQVALAHASGESIAGRTGGIEFGCIDGGGYQGNGDFFGEIKATMCSFQIASHFASIGVMVILVLVILLCIIGVHFVIDASARSTIEFGLAAVVCTRHELAEYVGSLGLLVQHRVHLGRAAESDSGHVQHES